MNGQNLVRHQAVLSFLRMQEGKQLGETRESMSRTVARCFGKGTYFARRLITWEIEWIAMRTISEGRRGCFVKVKSWLCDEGVLLAVREWIQEQPADQITAYGLAKAVGDYLDSKKAASTVEKILQFGLGGNRIRARTARRWLNQLGLVYGRYRKGVDVDGHEREDVVLYRNEVFLPHWKSLQRRMVIFQEDESGTVTWSAPPTLLPSEKPLVLVTHDESTFNANDGKRQGWMKKGEQPLLQKGKGRGIMVSGFLTPGGRLRVPDSISDHELERNPMWVMHPDGKGPVRDSMWLHEYGKDNYWNGEKMVWPGHALIRVFFFLSTAELSSLHKNRYGRPCESQCQYSSMPFLDVKLSLPSIMRPITAALLQMHCLLAIFLLILEASSLACERDLIMGEVCHKLWYTLVITHTLQYVANPREQRQFFMNVVSGHAMAGALMGSSLNWSARKVAEGAVQNWIVLLAAVLGGFSLSNGTFGNRRDNYKRRLRLQITSLSSTRSFIAS